MRGTDWGIPSKVRKDFVVIYDQDEKYKLIIRYLRWKWVSSGSKDLVSDMKSILKNTIVPGTL